MGFEKGQKATLRRDIIEPATGDHPGFLLGRKGETVTIISHEAGPPEYPLLVEGPTNPGKPWRAKESDFCSGADQ